MFPASEMSSAGSSSTQSSGLPPRRKYSSQATLRRPTLEMDTGLCNPANTRCRLDELPARTPRGTCLG